MFVPFVFLLVLLMTRTRFSEANGDEDLLIDLEALSETVFQKPDTRASRSLKYACFVSSLSYTRKPLGIS